MHTTPPLYALQETQRHKMPTNLTKLFVNPAERLTK